MNAERAVKESRLCMSQLEKQRGKTACMNNPIYESQL